MPGTVNIYFIWYGNWTNGPHASDSQTTKSLVDILFDSGGMGASGYALINSTYCDTTHNVSGNFVLAASTTNNYSKGPRLSDSGVLSVVSRALTSHALPSDTNGVYFVLTSSDVSACSIADGITGPRFLELTSSTRSWEPGPVPVGVRSADQQPEWRQRCGRDGVDQGARDRRGDLGSES